MKFRYTPLKETVLTTAFNAGLPQAALGQRPSDAYKLPKRKLIRPVNRKRPR